MRKMKMAYGLVSLIVFGGGIAFATPSFCHSNFSQEAQVSNPYHQNLNRGTHEGFEDLDSIVLNDGDYVVEYWGDKHAQSFAKGSGTESDPYQVSTPEELAYISYLTNLNHSSFSGRFFILTDDIILNDGYFEEDGTYHDGGDGVLNVWSSIGKISAFKSVINGQGHEIKGLYQNGKTNDVGLFSNFGSAKVLNLHLKDAYIYRESSIAGGFCAMPGSNITIDNCSFSGYVITAPGATGSVGGIVGIGGKGITNCKNYGTIISDGNYVGGISGNANGSTIEDCENYGIVKCHSNSRFVGGIVGLGNALNCNNYGQIIAKTITGGISGKTLNLKNCNNYGKVQGHWQVAGICGMIESEGGIIENCNNFGVVVNTSGQTGGIVSYLYKSTILNCCNEGTIIATRQVGGLVGYADASEITNCGNVGFLDASDDAVAGIVGQTVNACKIVNCFNYGDSIGKNTKGIVTWKSVTTEISNCISMASFAGVSLNEIYVVSYSKFSINFKTGKIYLTNGHATTVFQGKVTKDVLLGKGFVIYE